MSYCPAFFRGRLQNVYQRDFRRSSLKSVPRAICTRPRCACPIYGVRASAGRRARMEDAVSIVENLLEVTSSSPFGRNTIHSPILNGTTPEYVRRLSREAIDTEIYHFFGVYDGHNGPYAAHHCRGRLHENLKATYMNLYSTIDRETQSASVPADVSATVVQEFAPSSSRSRLETLPITTLNGQATKLSTTDTEQAIFLETFRQTDHQFSEYRCAERVGTTALTALISTNQITVGSCGDSRAVMYRNGQAIQLSNDHRLDVTEEKERIENSGGKVTYWNGPRVMGVLAMSRAIGDLCFRQYGVICDPEVMTTRRSVEDEYLVLATDGMWDVLTNEEAYRIIRHTVASNRAHDFSLEECIQSAANRLTKIALDRGSRDNITVILIDLQSDAVSTATKGSAQHCA